MIEKLKYKLHPITKGLTENVIDDPNWHINQLIDKTNEIIDDAINAEDTEWEERTVHVEVTGRDEVADGTVSNPFKTIRAALANVKTHIKADVTVKFGIGTFDLDINDFDRLSQVFVHTEIRLTIEGTPVVLVDGTLGLTRTGGDPWLYDGLISGGSPSWSTNEFQDKFIGSGGLPKKVIYKNSATQMGIAENDGATSEDSIIELGTKINVLGKRYLDTIDTPGFGQTYFDYLHFLMPDEQRLQQPRNGIKMQVNNCVFETTVANKSNQYQTKAKQFFNTYYNSIFICNFTTTNNPVKGAVRFNGSALYNCVIRNKGTATGGLAPGLHITNEWFALDECVFMNFAHAIDLDNGADLKLEGDLLIEDCGNAIRLYIGGSRVQLNNFQFYLNNVDYMFSSYQTYSDMYVDLGPNDVVGTPDTAWRVPYTPSTGLWGAVNIGTSVLAHHVNNDRARRIYIRMPNEFPSLEENLIETLTNNATTNIVIGSKARNHSMFIKYSIVRDNETETNTLQISNNGVAVAVAEGTLTGQDAGASFAVAYDSDDIQLQVTLDNDVEGSFKYNIERTIN